MRTITPVLVIITSLLFSGCVSNRQAIHEATKNATWISGVKLGQSQAEVGKIMHKGPESTSVKTLPDGTLEESWNYLTDYANDKNTTIVFRNGAAIEISQTKWLGNGTFNEPRTMP